MNDQIQRLSRIAGILQHDNRYKLEAYVFVIEALGFEIEQLGLRAPDKHRHLTAKELLDGVRELGWKRYGRLSKDVLEGWGIKSSADIGEIVFNLIEVGEFSKTDEDKREDFRELLDFDRDLVKAYKIGDASKN